MRCAPRSANLSARALCRRVGSLAGAVPAPARAFIHAPTCMTPRRAGKLVYVLKPVRSTPIWTLYTLEADAKHGSHRDQTLRQDRLLG